MGEHCIGHVEHYFPKAHAAVVKLEDDLHVGDRIHIVGHTTDLTEKVPRMEVDHKAIEEAHAGDEIAVQVADRVRAHDDVYRVT